MRKGREMANGEKGIGSMGKATGKKVPVLSSVVIMFIEYLLSPRL